MAGVTWRDCERSEGVARICGVGELDGVLRRRRLRWFGDVERRDGSKALGRIQNMEVTGRRRPGRPKKRCKKNMEEDQTELNMRREQLGSRSKIVEDHRRPSHLVQMSEEDVKSISK
jgi:hypothetical protein